ncbi:MAG TPA: class I SAM-dependent methyltransferase [Chitinophagales bacterium]|nr:class I SAM-dependent methyltransferase [Chitinophagales bacterium]HRK27434.1 class I SAM-dependent methyltransferase [Chitinophagales bacterium]
MHHLLMFENRLQKRFKHLRKWAKREAVSCYRVYDRDIPEFPFCIDLYDKMIYFAEYERISPRTPDEQSAWLEACKQIACKVLNIQPDMLFTRRRQMQKGITQYEKLAELRHRQIIEENELRFMVNLSDYLDTGLFLDHRTTRGMVAAEAENKRFLNLFAYTGAFTVYAAAGGAAQTLTIDMSATYLQWAMDNMRLNGFIQAKNKYEQTDVLQWLHSFEKPAPLFDLAVIDPPTFSNSKRMKGIFDVQRDHVFLINRTLSLMPKGGVIYFSTNFRRFKPELASLRAAQITDITRQTLPEDFKNTKPHTCLRIVK